MSPTDQNILNNCNLQYLKANCADHGVVLEKINVSNHRITNLGEDMNKMGSKLANACAENEEEIKQIRTDKVSRPIFMWSLGGVGGLVLFLFGLIIAQMTSVTNQMHKSYNSFVTISANLGKDVEVSKVTMDNIKEKLDKHIAYYEKNNKQ